MWNSEWNLGEFKQLHRDFQLIYCQNLQNRMKRNYDNQDPSQVLTRVRAHKRTYTLPYGGGLEYPYRSPGSRRRRRKGNPVSGTVSGPPCHWGT
jgi:hypothetical protein